jgi:Flp pilus assembly protein protease CpaA
MESMSEIAPFLDGIIPQWLILVLLAASVVARVTKQKDLETVVPPADDDTLFV